MELPELILLDDYDGDWEKYLDALYFQFREDFMENGTLYKGQKLRLKKYPFIKEKEVTFWHLISSGLVESDRLPDLRRCERIGWPKVLIENVKDKDVKVWEQERNGEKRVCICYGEWEYIVVLADRKTYVLLWTAFCVEYNHQKRKYKKEYEKYCTTKLASKK